ncbi:hypothetical protein [Nocardia farcinica]|uniref:hypothetical protein n=1 Tax=Nocardia farcinica TaxID=37329 RepID=UPI002454B5F3|nr:hypothetical protein [Nocardia farcinica]
MRSETFARRLMLSVDAVGYGSRDDQRQRSAQSAIPAVLDRAARYAGLDRSVWETQEGGDGELAILPAAQADAEPVLVEDFVRELHTALAAHNRDLCAEARLRLRLAIHNGVAKRADYGYAGQGVVAVSRLVDSAVAKSVMRAVPTASLAVILSDRVFADVVAQGHVSLTPSMFRRFSVRNKEFQQQAYLYLPGDDIHAVALPDEHDGEQHKDATELETTATPGSQPRPSPPPARPAPPRDTWINGWVPPGHEG